jgi:hypothetical protein
VAFRQHSVAVDPDKLNQRLKEEQISCSEKASLNDRVQGRHAAWLRSTDVSGTIGLAENEEDHLFQVACENPTRWTFPTRFGQDLSDDAVVRLHDQAAQLARVCGQAYN